MGAIDLHVHSCFSHDGEFAPAVLVSMAADAGLRVMCIADHNGVDAVEPALEAGRAQGVLVIPGVELDCCFEDVPLHVLGYFIDHADPRFSVIHDNVERQEEAASDRRMDLLAALGFVFDRTAVRETAGGGVITPEFIAQAALDHPANADDARLAPYRRGGARADNPFANFYWDYFAPGKACHVPIDHISFAEAVSLIHAGGGVPVLAHPGVVLKGREDLLAVLAERGIAGVEAYSSYHNAGEREFWRRLGNELGLAVTCGSDFHGRVKPSIVLGGHAGDAHEEKGLADLLARRGG